MGHAIHLIGGPTASGKSALALRMAAALDGEIVNADSMQIYGGLRILTGRPTEAEEALAPHHLFGIADPGEAWSVGRWLASALETLEAIRARGRTAIVVGGTGLYLRALTSGLADIPPVSAKTRNEALAMFEAIGERAFRERLAAVDPEAAKRIASGDRQRLCRAMAVFLASGRALSDWRSATRPALAPGSWRGLVLDPPRDELYRRCDARLDAMLAAGALAEVAALADRGLDAKLPAMKALGVSPFAAHLRGELSLAEAMNRARLDTRRYVKRQLTWFRNQTPDWPRSTR